jgi:hypothetical protein
MLPCAHIQTIANCTPPMHIVFDQEMHIPHRGVWLDALESMNAVGRGECLCGHDEKSDLEVRVGRLDERNVGKREGKKMAKNLGHEVDELCMCLGCAHMQRDEEVDLKELRSQIAHLEADLKRFEKEEEVLCSARLRTLPSICECGDEETRESLGRYELSARSTYVAVSDEVGDQQLRTRMNGPGHGKYAPKSLQGSWDEERHQTHVCKCAHTPEHSPTLVIHPKSGFTVQSGSERGSKYVFEDPVTVYHFPNDADGNALWEDVLREHTDKYGKSGRTQTDIIRMEGPEGEYQVKSAIARHFDSTRLLEIWLCGGHGENIIVPDKTIPSNEEPTSQAHMRGGNGTVESFHNDDFAEDLDSICDHLAQTASDEAMSSCTQAWINFAGTLQMQNIHLERQIEEYKDMYASVVADLKWNMERLAELEDEIEDVREERVDALVELAFLKRKQKEKETKRQGEGEGKENIQRSKDDDKPVNHESSLLLPKESLEASQLQSRQEPATSFYFYPARSVIILPGNPAQILQFPRGTSLHEIREMLNRQHKNNIEMDSCASKIRDIMSIREAMGIQLPNSLLNEAVLISLPNVHTTNPSTKIAAWQTVDKESTEFINQPHVTHTSITTPPNPVANPITSPNPPTSPCPCTLCTPKFKPHAPPIVSIRGGGDEDVEDYDFDDYEIDDVPYDSDDEEEDVEHEDEAREPWEGWRGGGRDDWNDFGEWEFDPSGVFRRHGAGVRGEAGGDGW